MKLSDLKPNVKNPRKISGKKLEALKKSVEKFGDLSGFIYNRRTKTLVSGHQRQKALPANATIKIEVKHEAPTRANTVAEGYVLIEGERFKYREVDASPEWEIEALLAANSHGGEWDADLLRLNLADFPTLDLELAGFDMHDLEELNIRLPRIEPKVETPVSSSSDWDATDENPAAHYPDDQAEETDEEYLQNNPGEDSRLEKERIPSTVNDSRSAFDETKEQTEIPGKRYVIIIDCKDQESKDKLKELLQPQVADAGAKIF